MSKVALNSDSVNLADNIDFSIGSQISFVAVRKFDRRFIVGPLSFETVLLGLLHKMNSAADYSIKMKTILLQKTVVKMIK